MGALDTVIGMLESQPWSARCIFVIRRYGRLATLHRGAMQACVREVGDGTVEVLYESGFHEATRIQVGAEVASRLLLAIMQRESLVPVDLPNAEQDSASDPPHDIRE